MALSDFSFNQKLILNWIAKHANGADFADTEFQDAQQWLQTFDFGTASEEVNQLYVGDRTVASGANDDIDLSGSLTNFVGETVTFSRIKLILIYNPSTLAGEILTLGGGGSNSWIAPFGASSTFKDSVYPSGLWLRTAPLDGFLVTAGSADILRVHNSGTLSVTYPIIIAGLN